MRRWPRLVWAATFLVVAHPAFPSLQARAIPSRASVTAKPGEPSSRDVSIQNDGDGSVVVHVRLSDWTLDPDGDLHLVPAGTTPASLQGLVTFEPSEFSLGPGESGVIHVTMRMPADGPATRWGVLLSEVRPAVTPQASFGSRAIAELGTTLYLSRAGADRVQADVVGMDVRPAGDTTIVVGVRLRNSGDRHLYSTGQIAVKDSTGHAIAAGDLGTNVVLPGMERRFTWTCTTSLAPGRYTVTATLDTGEPELIVGETEVRWSPTRPAIAAHGDSP